MPHPRYVLVVAMDVVHHVQTTPLLLRVQLVAMDVVLLVATILRIHVQTVQNNVLILAIRPVILVVNQAVEEAATMHAIVAIRCVVMVQKVAAMDVEHHVKTTALQRVLMDVTNNQKTLKLWFFL